MKIILIALTDTYDTLLPALKEKNHEYKLIDQYSCPGRNIYYGGPGVVEWVQEEIRKFSPDIVINNMAGLLLPPSSSYTYFGNSVLSSALEMNKWETRQQAESLDFGFLFPEVVLECNLDEMVYFPYTTFLKSKGNDTFCQAWKVTPDTDLKHHNHVLQHHEGIKCPAFVEKKVDFEVEGYCQFRVTNGTYNITDIKGTYGDGGGYKTLQATTDWREDCCTIDISKKHRDAIEEVCSGWLDYASSFGGSYEGNIGSGITSDSEVYWFEHNSRHTMYSTFQGDADDWLNSFITNSDENFWVFLNEEYLGPLIK